MIKWISSSFHRKIGTLLLVSGLSMTLVYTSFNYHREKVDLHKLLQQQTQQLGKTLSLLISNDVRYNKYYPLWNNLNQIYKENSHEDNNSGRLFYIQEIVVIDNNNQILSHTDPKNHPLLSEYHSHLDLKGFKSHQSTLLDSDVFIKSIPVLYSGEKLGSLIISFDSAPLITYLKRLFSESIILTIAIFLSIIIITAIMVRLVDTPLRKITRQLANLGKNKVELTSLTQKQDEFGQLARTIEDVDKKLYKDKIALDEYQTHLENLVAKRTAKLESTQEELVKSERLAVLGQLTATVSHELRNPLGAIRPSLYVLRKRIPDADVKLVGVLDRIDRNVQRCDHIVDELLDFTRAKQLELSNIELNTWLRQIINEQEITNDITISLNMSDKDIHLDADINRLRRAIINVVENGCHAMLKEYEIDEYEPNSVLTIETKQDSEFAYLVVADNGCGMTDDIVKKIFVPLFSTKGFGVGLGMPSVQKIIQQHHGEMTVSSKLNMGTTITFKLPKQQPDITVNQ